MLSRVKIRKGRECRTRYIPRVILCVRRVMWLPALHTWLTQGAKHLIFLKSAKNRGVFHDFYARFFVNAHSVLRSASVFSQNRARISLHSRPCPQLAIWIEHSHWSIFEFRARDFPKTSHTGHIARSILSSLPYYLLLMLFRLELQH
jgi:hypothetical protein